ncbi:hypothetical protein SAMN02799624_06042 [Paenibacillus sp. UNC496MF]|nr:hypothetical protein SAMN02799624_06042 [Paenibacillus sp. UNC496MF]
MHGAGRVGSRRIKEAGQGNVTPKPCLGRMKNDHYRCRSLHENHRKYAVAGAPDPGRRGGDHDRDLGCARIPIEKFLGVRPAARPRRRGILQEGAHESLSPAAAESRQPNTACVDPGRTIAARRSESGAHPSLINYEFVPYQLRIRLSSTTHSVPSSTTHPSLIKLFLKGCRDPAAFFVCAAGAAGAFIPDQES